MNTKGIKFLAVLAVMVMAFAAVIALAPADKDVEAVAVYNNDAVVVDPTVIEGTTEKQYYYISDDATVKIKGLTKDVTFYVENGKELELTIKGSFATQRTITIFSVTADQQRPTTSTVDVDREDSGSQVGKIILQDTKVQFKVVNPTTPSGSTVNESVVYTALMPYSVTTYTTSGSKVVTETYTYDQYASSTKRPSTQQYATISSDAVLDGTIARLVTVAPGQAIQTKAAVDMNYGIMSAIANGTTTEFTYYANGMNAGAITVANSDYVIINNGSATVSTADSSTSIKATSATGGVTLTGKNGNIEVSGTLKTGTMTVSGKVAFATEFENKATVTLNSSADASGEMKVTGKLYLKNDKDKIKNLDVKGKGTIIAENEKLWTYSGTTPSLVFANSASEDFQGQYDVYAITKVAEVKDAFSTALIEKNQTFVVVSDTVVTTALNVQGILIVQPGVTLTISKINGIGATVTATGQYAQIINYGQILIQSTAPETTATTTTTVGDYGLHIHGGLMQNDGKIVASSDSKALAAGKPSLCVEFKDGTTTTYGAGFINNGTITTSRNDIVSLDSNFSNAKSGSVSISGTLVSTGLKNGGVFTLNNAKIGSQLTVEMSSGATFTIGSAEVVSGAVITVKDSYNKHSVTLTVPTFTDGKFTVRGITITGKSSSLDVSGTFAVSKPTTTGTTTIADVELATKGYIDVSSTANIGKGYKLDMATTTYMTVSGAMTVAKDVGVKSLAGLTLKVPGIVTCVGDDHFGTLADAKVIAAKFTVGSDTIYTNLEDAVAGAILADTTIITVGGSSSDYVSVTDDVIIPTGMTVTGDYLVINGMATVAVEEDAMFSFESIVVKNGMITAEDANNINIDTVHADVKAVDDESTAAACASLNVALLLASEGDVIELSQDFYASDVDLVIPAGVTVNATAATTTTDFVLVNSNLVVNGNLIVENFKFIATTDDTIGITVNGYIYDKCAGGSCFVNWWYTPFGVSYFITDVETDQTWYVLTTIENIQPAINVADDAKVTVEGDAVLSELTVTGRDDMPAEVTFRGNVDIDNINIDEVTLKFSDGKKIDTTVSNAVGSITITGGYVDKYLSIYDMAIYSSEDVGVYMEGVVTDGDSTYGILFNGITGMDGTTTRTSINWTSDEEAPTIVFDGVTTVIGKKAYIQFDDDEGITGMVTITGTLMADNNSKIIINSDVQILGALVAAERTEDAVAGTIEVNGNMFVGTLESDIYSAQDALSAYDEDKAYADWEKTGAGYGKALMEPEVAGTAIVSGNIDVAKGYFITVMNESLIDPQIIEDLEHLDIIIEDTLWLTIYGYGDTDYSMDGLKAPIVNAKVTTILDAYGNPVAKFNHDYKVIYGSVEKDLSQYGEGVIISLDYEVFNVVIKTDGSVKAVYIDGILMYTGENRNTFTLDKVATGTHKVTVEAATGYDASKCVLYTEMGTILPGMAFTFTEFDCDNYSVTYNINGTEIQPEPVPPTPEEESQWTITTILLVILVVLIAIMAVIVALRLNRS